VSFVVGPPATVVRRSPPSLILARDAVEEQARVRKRTSPVDKGIGRSCVLGVPAELALLHPIQNALMFRLALPWLPLEAPSSAFWCRLQDGRSGEA